MVLTKTKVFWSAKTDGHENIIAEFDLKNLDQDYNNPGLVRIEISPPGWNFALPAEQWIYRLDQDVLPDWYDPEDAEKRTRVALEKWIETKVLLDGQHEVYEGTKYTSGSASVRASGSASVEAYGSASVRASGSASVEASGSASVEASGSASVEASGSASVEAYDSATIIKWWSQVSVELKAPNAVLVDRSGNRAVCYVGKLADALALPDGAVDERAVAEEGDD